MAQNRNLSGKRIAFIACDGVEQVELTQPWDAVRGAGAETELISVKPGTIQGMNHLDKADTFQVQRTFAEVSHDQYDALVIPGGVANPDFMRMHPQAVDFVRAFFESGKPIASICHGPWMLVEADIVRGRRVSSWPSLKTDIRNAGGTWVDEQVHVENGIVTSRWPDDLPAFSAKLIEEVAEGAHARQPVGAGAGAVR